MRAVGVTQFGGPEALRIVDAWPTARCRTPWSCPPCGGAVATVRGYRGDGSRGLRVFPTPVRRVAEDRAALDRLLERGGVRGRLVLTC